MHDVGVCHCHICRAWTSGPWMALQVPEANVEGDDLAVFRSSSFAERGFCRTCGSHIFHRPIDGPELAISAGLFRDPAQFVAREIFVDSQPRQYRFEGVESRRTGVSMALEWLPKILKRRVLRWLGRR
ncbi:GFA family protein [Blastomonas sp. SL216]|nr:GFA family protein [Blastomonas sp. SL216]